jgi:hypothetical protein
MTRVDGAPRLKGLGKRVAAQQGRDPISYRFLWDALGLDRG